MSNKYNKNDKVKWDWGKGTASGKIEQIYTEKIEKTIDKNQVTRNASNDNPAYLIKQNDGSKVLKSHSEISKSN